MGVYNIGIAEQKVARAPDKIITLGLGSCVGLVLYDTIGKVGGMVHIMLPTAPSDSISNKSKFADTAIVELISLLTQSGAARRNLKAKMAGGAHMFNNAYNKDIMNVGQRNIEMCRGLLRQNSIPIVSEDVGGSSGRSIEFCCESNQLEIRTLSPKSIRII